MSEKTTQSEPVLTILDPRGWEPDVEYQGITPRPESLDGKKVKVVNLHGGNEEVMEALANDLQEALPNSNISYYAVKGRWADLEPEDWDEITDSDAVILGHNY
ncbi:MAG: hypothetical protein JRI43_04075 [Deltaproteobacteria bacterium]|nr:hypothetical protein [Deltaproteobacteria bacterium]